MKAPREPKTFQMLLSVDVGILGKQSIQTTLIYFHEEWTYSSLICPSILPYSYVYAATLVYSEKAN